MAARRLLGLAALASAEYPGNFALTFKAEHGDIVRIPHEVSMQGPLIDSFTVELWVLVQPGAQLYPDEGRVVNLVGFPGRHPFLGLASDTGCACIQLKLANGTWYSYEGVTPIDDGQWHHVAATWDGTAPDPIERELALYVDGELEAAGGLGARTRRRASAGTCSRWRVAAPTLRPARPSLRVRVRQCAPTGPPLSVGA